MDEYTEKARIARLSGVANYHLWSVQVESILMGQDVWEPVEKGLSELSTDSKDPEQAKKEAIQDAKARSIIMLSCNQSVILNILGLRSAKAQWDKLKTLYSPVGNEMLRTRLKEYYSFEVKRGDKMTDIIT
jgi:hypothetical protein